MSRRILVADDDATFRETTARLLRQAGYECMGAPDAAAAMERLRESDFDLLLADIHMPGNDGLELIADLPQVASGLPVILVTGAPSVETAAQSVRLAVAAYLFKPPHPEELLTVARQAMERYQIYRAIKASRQRWQAGAQELARLEAALQHSSRAGAAGLVSNYLNLTFQSLLAALADLKPMMEAVGRQEAGSEALARIPLVEALREAVAVLERTRQSFKSKELGDLRRKLERLLAPT